MTVREDSVTSTTGMSSSGGGGGRGGSRRSTKGSVHSLSIDGGGDHEVDTLVFIEVGGAGTQVPSAAQPPATNSNHATNSLKSCSISSKDSFPTAAVCTAVAAKTTKQPPFVMPESMPESLDSPEDEGNDRSGGHCLSF